MAAFSKDAAALYMPVSRRLWRALRDRLAERVEELAHHRSR